jgi:hypothetical protein
MCKKQQFYTPPTAHLLPPSLRARAREFPGHTFFIVTKRLIKKSTEQWETPSHDLLGVVYGILSREVNKMVDDHFQRFRYGRLHQNVK